MKDMTATEVRARVAKWNHKYAVKMQKRWEEFYKKMIEALS